VPVTRYVAQAGSMNGSMNGSVNVITNNVNNNVVNAIINDSFTEHCIIDTGSYLSFLDHNFVKMHKLCITPFQPCALRTYIAAVETRITAIGTTIIVLPFSGEQFPFSFKVIDRLSTNILIGMNIITMYNCVLYANKNLFTLGGARIVVPMVVEGNVLGLAKLREAVTLQPNTQQIVGLNCPKINNQSVFLLEPIMREDTHSFCVQRTILSTKGWHYCQLCNPTNEPITLRSGALIGQLAPVSDILSVAQDNDPAAIADVP